MGYITVPEKKIPVSKNTDILVCGGGVAGFSAAIAAARMGAQVLLVERYGFLGGLATAALVITVPPMNNGFSREIRDRLTQLGAYGPMKYPAADVVALGIRMDAYDPEVFKHEMVAMLQEEKVGLLLHTYIVDAIVDDNILKGIIIENKGGRQAVLAKMTVDATGDADVIHFSKAPYTNDADGATPMTMMFNMTGVDSEKAIAQVGNWSHVHDLLRKSIENGEVKFDLGITMKGGGPGVSIENLVYPDEVNIWSGNLFGRSGIDPVDLTEAEIITREHAHVLAEWLRKHIRGFENARIELLSTQVGVRKTRQIKPGSLDSDGIVSKPYSNSTVALPYSSLVPQMVDNLLVAGRCVHAKEDRFGGVFRLIPPCLNTGQSAGLAAAMALDSGVTPAKVDVKRLQQNLIRAGQDLNT